MSPPTYDTHASVLRLTAAGMPEPQAASIVNEQVQLLAETIATKDDVRDVRQDIKALELRIAGELRDMRQDFKALDLRMAGELRDVRQDMKTHDLQFESEFTKVRADISVLRADMQAMESRITAKLGGLMIALVGALAAVIRFF